MVNDAVEPNGTLRYRLERIEADIRELRSYKLDVITERMDALSREFANLEKRQSEQSLDSIRRMQSVSNRLLGLALSIAAGAVIFALTATGVWGH